MPLTLPAAPESLIRANRTYSALTCWQPTYGKPAYRWSDRASRGVGRPVNTAPYRRAVHSEDVDLALGKCVRNAIDLADQGREERQRSA